MSRLVPATPALFASAELYARELVAAEVPALQVFLDANPEYFMSVNGRPPNPNEAQIEFEELPPPHLGFGRRWVAGVFDSPHELVGVAGVLSDLCAPRVWHIGLLILATRLHGQGLAGPLYMALEEWANRNGALWLRLGVVKGNARAEHFWSRHGFREVRVRVGIDTGGRVNDLRVLVKPLGNAGLAEYLELVPRDQPHSTLP